MLANQQIHTAAIVDLEVTCCSCLSLQLQSHVIVLCCVHVSIVCMAQIAHPQN